MPRFLKYCFSVVFVIVLSAGSVFAQGAKKQEDVSLVCRADKDCVFVGNACISGAVAKRFKSQAQRLGKQVDAEMSNCNGPYKGPEPLAYCDFPVIPCAGRQKTEKCYARTGECALR